MRSRTTDLVLRLGLSVAFLLALALVIGSAKDRWFWDNVWGGKKGTYLLLGLPVTLLVSALAMVLGLVLGLLAGLGRMSRHLVPNQISNLYVEFIRGTPLLVQILIAYFCISQVVGIDDKMTWGVLALGVFSGAYIAEIFRAGVESVPRGQTEAARSLGMTHTQAMVKVVGPQALKNALPPLTGQFINLVKDSSLLMVIGVAELTKRSDEVMSSTYAQFEVLIPLAGLYLLLTIPLSLFTRWLERKMGGGDGGHRI